MFGDIALFWSKEKVVEIIKRDNSVKASFIELLKSTIISAAVLGIVVAFKLKFLNESLSLKTIGNSPFFIVYAVFLWLNSLVYAWYLKRNIGKAKANQEDALADFLVVTNTFQMQYIWIISLVLSLEAMLSSSRIGLILGLFITFLSPFVWFLNAFLLGRVQVIALEEIYTINRMNAFGVVFGAYLASMLFGVMFFTLVLGIYSPPIELIGMWF